MQNTEHVQGVKGSLKRSEREDTYIRDVSGLIIHLPMLKRAVNNANSSLTSLQKV
jgi:hypothetical protein